MCHWNSSNKNRPTYKNFRYDISPPLEDSILPTHAIGTVSGARLLSRKEFICKFQTRIVSDDVVTTLIYPSLFLVIMIQRIKLNIVGVERMKMIEFLHALRASNFKNCIGV
jgi:hypothetical protein